MRRCDPRMVVLPVGSDRPARSTPGKARAWSRPRLTAWVWAACLVALAATLCCPEAAALQVDARETTIQAVVRDIRLESDGTIDESRVLAKLSTRPGRRFDPQVLDRDVKTLYTTHWFTQVETQVIEAGPGAVDVVFKVVEAPILNQVEFRGMTKLKLKDVEQSTRLKVGGRADPVQTRLAVNALKQLYAEKGYEQAEVRIVEGDRLGQTRAILEIFEGPRSRVSEVQFRGNTAFSSALLKTKIQTRAAILGFGGRFFRDQLEADARALREYYQSLGYLEVQVSASALSGETPGSKVVAFDIAEGPRYTVRDVTFEGNEKLDEGTLRANLKLHSGKAYRDLDRDADRQAIVNTYAERGYLFAEVVVEPRFTETRGVIDLVYRIREGEAYRLGELVVRGNSITKDEVIRREAVMAGVLPGEVLDRNRIEAFRTRLANTGFFITSPELGKPIEVRLANPRPANQPYAEMSVSPSGFGIGGVGPRVSVEASAGSPPSQPAPGLGGRGPGPFRSARMQQPPELPPLASPPPADDLEAVPFGQGAGGLFAPPPDIIPETTVPVIPAPGPSDLTLPPGRLLPELGEPPIGRPGVSNTPPGLFPNLPGTNSTSVGPDLTEPFPERSFADIIAQVEEGPTGRFMFGFGASSFGGLYGHLIFHERNFDLFNPPRSLSDITDFRAFRGGGQDFRVELAPGTVANRIVVSYRHPYFLELPVGIGTDYTPIALGVSGYTLNRFFPDFNEGRTGGRFSIGGQFTPSAYADLAFRIEDVNFDGFRYPAPADYLAAAGHTTLATLRPSLRFDSRDNPVIPSAGGYLEMAFEQGWGDFTFSKATVEGRKYFTVFSRPDGTGKHIISTRGFYGVSTRDLPVYERFFAGDFRSMRGFAFRGVGPYALNANLGGVMSLVGSVEYQFPWTADDRFQQVIFCDFGTVENDYTISTFRAAVGTGVRIIIPALSQQLPLAFDLAFPVVKGPDDREQIFTFFIGAFW
jgi:outer membrane protein insertion porin family